MKTWPSWMPNPSRSGYSYTPIDRRTKTDMEVSGVYRVEFDTDEAQVSCQITLNNLQAAYFEKFEKDYLKQGATWFYFPLWYGGRLKNTLVRFADRPKINNVIGVAATIYTLTLDVKQRESMMCDQVFELLECFTVNELLSLCDNVYTVLNTKLPGITIHS